MKAKTYGILVASVGAIALTVATNQTFAAARGGHGGSHGFAAHSLRHHHHNRQQQQQDGGFVWSGDGGYYYGPTGDTGAAGMPLTGEFRNSNASDISWDWAHRYPPVLGPSGRPYVSSCGDETVTVPDGHGGTGQVNVTRCY